MILRKAVPRAAPVSRQFHIAFVACNRNPRRFHEDPSYIYRCENLGFTLQGMGYRVSFIHLSAIFFTDLPDVVVFHRPRFSRYFALVLYWLRRCGVTLVADVDDLVFDESFAEFSPGVIDDLVPLKKTRTRFLAHRLAMELFDAITVSTEPLKRYVNQCFPKARIQLLPNAVHQTWRQVQTGFDKTLKEPIMKSQQQLVVTYFPGTRGHNRDFTVFAEGVGAFLAKYPKARLEVTGPLNFDLAARPGQVIHHAKLRFEHYHKRVQSGWVNLAPLMDSPFTHCKSALKVLEAGYWGIPTVCTPLPDANRFLDSGALYADDAEACYKQLEMMVEDTYYQQVTAGLSAKVLAMADVDVMAYDFLRFVGILPTEEL